MAWGRLTASLPWERPSFPVGSRLCKQLPLGLVLQEAVGP